MAGSFTWSAMVRVGSLKPYPNALVITVVHEFVRLDADAGSTSTPVWNSVVCFRQDMRKRLAHNLSPGDLVHLQGHVKTSTFKDETEAKRRAVDLVVTQYDVLQKHIDALPESI